MRCPKCGCTSVRIRACWNGDLYLTFKPDKPGEFEVDGSDPQDSDLDDNAQVQCRDCGFTHEAIEFAIKTGRTVTYKYLLGADFKDEIGKFKTVYLELTWPAYGRWVDSNGIPLLNLSDGDEKHCDEAEAVQVLEDEAEAHKWTDLRFFKIPEENA